VPIAIQRRSTDPGRAPRVPYLLLLAVATLATASRATLAQVAAEPAVRFEGVFRIGMRPAASGGRLTAWAVRSAMDMTLCGVGTFKPGGAYTLEITARAECANQGNGRRPVVFVLGWNGEQVGTDEVSVDLESPAGQNRAVELDLEASGFNPARPSGMRPVFRRIYGTLTLGAGESPAPAGEQILLYAERSGTDSTLCGIGRTIDGGHYSIDVQAEPGCAREGNEGRAVFFAFVWRRQRVGAREVALSLHDRTTVGVPVLMNLSGRDPR
jgi:hypothetical protein